MSAYFINQQEEDRNPEDMDYHTRNYEQKTQLVQIQNMAVKQWLIQWENKIIKTQIKNTADQFFNRSSEKAQQTSYQIN